MSSISAISSAALPEAPKPSGQARSGEGFQDVFAAAIRSVEASRSEASASVGRFLAGEGEELHTAVLATQRAELTFELFLQARTKVVNAYQEIMRMPV